MWPTSVTGCWCRTTPSSAVGCSPPVRRRRASDPNRDDGRRRRPDRAATREPRIHAPYEPLRDEDFYTVDGQREILTTALLGYAAGTMVPLAIVDGDDQIIGRLNLNGIVRGALQSAAVDTGEPGEQRAGIASAAVAEAVDLAFVTSGCTGCSRDAAGQHARSGC